MADFLKRMKPCVGLTLPAGAAGFEQSLRSEFQKAGSALTDTPTETAKPHLFQVQHRVEKAHGAKAPHPPIPHSSFLIPHSSFLIPHSSFLIPKHPNLLHTHHPGSSSSHEGRRSPLNGSTSTQSTSQNPLTSLNQNPIQKHNSHHIPANPPGVFNQGSLFRLRAPQQDTLYCSASCLSLVAGGQRE